MNKPLWAAYIRCPHAKPFNTVATLRSELGERRTLGCGHSPVLEGVYVPFSVRGNAFGEPCEGRGPGCAARDDPGLAVRNASA